MVVVGDGRSGDPLHERDDKRDVYEGEIAKVDLVSELVRRVYGVVMARGPHVSVARAALAVFPSTMGGGCSRCESVRCSPFTGKPSPVNSGRRLDVWAQVVGAAVPVRGAWYLADGLGERGCPVGDQGLVCDVRGVGKALAAVPEG